MCSASEHKEVFVGDSVERRGVFLAFWCAGALSAQREGTEPVQLWEMSWKGQSRESVGQMGQNWSRRRRYFLGSRSWRKLSNEAFFSERWGCEWYCKINFHGFEECIWGKLYWRETEIWSRFFLSGCKYLVLLSEISDSLWKNQVFLRVLCCAQKQPKRSWFKKKSLSLQDKGGGGKI